MEKSIFIHEELLAQAQITLEMLAEWEQLKLIKPLGTTEDGQLYYSDAVLQRIEQIKSLLQVGYEIKEVQKIIKKIGLPRSSKDGDKADLNEFLTVGDLAVKVGVSPRTIKHWEDKGIIAPDLRSQGGFRLYSQTFVTICKLVQDLQLFGYSLEQIKIIADSYRDFLAIQNNPEIYNPADMTDKLLLMETEITTLYEKMTLFRQGIQRWEDLVKKKKKEVGQLIQQNKKRLDGPTKEKT